MIPPPAIPARVGLYCPGSGSEGRAFEKAFCSRCVYYRDDDHDDAFYCPINSAAWDIADAQDVRYPNQWRYDEHGEPTCTAFVEQDEFAAEREREMYEKAMRGE